MSEQEQGFLLFILGLLLILSLGWGWEAKYSDPSTGEQPSISKGSLLVKIFCGLLGLSLSVFGILKLGGLVGGA